MSDLFDLAEGGDIGRLELAGAWPAFRFGVLYWQLPDGRCVTEEEALAWLRRRTKKGDEGGEA